MMLSAGPVLYKSLNSYFKAQPSLIPSKICCGSNSIPERVTQGEAKWEPCKENHSQPSSGASAVTFYATIFEKSEAFPSIFSLCEKTAARSRSQHGDEYPSLPGKVLLCSWSFCTAYLTATFAVLSAQCCFLASALHDVHLLSVHHREGILFTIYTCTCDTELPGTACVITSAFTFSLGWL